MPLATLTAPWTEHRVNEQVKKNSLFSPDIFRTRFFSQTNVNVITFINTYLFHFFFSVRVFQHSKRYKIVFNLLLPLLAKFGDSSG